MWQHMVPLVPKGYNWSGRTVCEIGPGGRGLMAALRQERVGRVILVDPNLPDADLRDGCATMDGGSIGTEFIQGTWERIGPTLAGQCDVILSHCVLEHVVDKAAFFKACWDALSPGGWMAHYVDIGGHGCFEDPMHPLAFQTIPDRLYRFLYAPEWMPPTRHFPSDYVQALSMVAFKCCQTIPMRMSADDEVDAIRPWLRRGARSRAMTDLRVVEFGVVAAKGELRWQSVDAGVRGKG
jgi:SAM-dependent methyltransferase